MPTPIIIKIGDLELNGEFNDTPAGQAAAEAPPFAWQYQWTGQSGVPHLWD